MCEVSVETGDSISKENLHAILVACRSIGVNTVHVTFDGGGDEGQIDSAEFYGAADAPSSHENLVDVDSSMLVAVKAIKKSFNEESRQWDNDIIDMRVALPDAVYDLVNALAENCGVNWYDNDGGSGAWRVTGILTGSPTVSFSVDRYEMVSNTVLSESETLCLDHPVSTVEAC